VLLKCLRDFNDTADGRLRAVIQRHTADVLVGDLFSVQAAFEAERMLLAAGARAVPLLPGQAPAADKPLLPEILGLFSSLTPLSSLRSPVQPPKKFRLLRFPGIVSGLWKLTENPPTWHSPRRYPTIHSSKVTASATIGSPEVHGAAIEANAPYHSNNMAINGRTKRSSSTWGLCNGSASSACTPTFSTTSSRGGSGAGTPWWRHLASPPYSLTTTRWNDVPCRAAGASLTITDTIDRRARAHLIALHDQFQDGLHRILRNLPGITFTTDKSDISTHSSVGIGREREDHCFDFRRATIFWRHQAELGFLLAALGAQQRHHPKHFSFAIPRSRRS